MSDSTPMTPRGAIALKHFRSLDEDLAVLGYTGEGSQIDGGFVLERGYALAWNPHTGVFGAIHKQWVMNLGTYRSPDALFNTFRPELAKADGLLAQKVNGSVDWSNPALGGGLDYFRQLAAEVRYGQRANRQPYVGAVSDRHLADFFEVQVTGPFDPSGYLCWIGNMPETDGSFADLRWQRETGRAFTVSYLSSPSHPADRDGIGGRVPDSSYSFGVIESEELLGEAFGRFTDGYAPLAPPVFDVANKAAAYAATVSPDLADSFAR